MVRTTRLLGDVRDALSLGQGAVYWGPCEQAVTEAAQHATEPEFYSYGHDHGIASLREALLKKIKSANNLHGYNICITAGANQAVASLMITLLDPGDRAVMFRPYYFNALMAVQMMGGGQSAVLGPCDPETMHPDLDWLEEQLQGPARPKLVYLVNPSNPTALLRAKHTFGRGNTSMSVLNDIEGVDQDAYYVLLCNRWRAFSKTFSREGVTLSKEEIERLAKMTAAASTWLVLDNTYENFLFSGAGHHTVDAPHVFHVFSFSKAHGLMGWRIGYIAYPDHDGSDHIGLQLIKVQDTIPIHSSIMSQKVALGTLRHGAEYTRDKIDTLRSNRSAALEALQPLGSLGRGVWGGDAIYLWAQLPDGCIDDVRVTKWLAHKHGVVVIPGTGCGAPGFIRVAFGKPEPEQFRAAAMRLNAGLKELALNGMASIG